MTVFDAINGRKSIRAYQDKPVEREKLERILEAGRLAPTARKTNATKIIVVTDEALRRKLVEASFGQEMLLSAPIALVVCSNSEIGTMGCEQKASSLDCSIALSFMMLEAYEQGLGTCWMGGFTQPPVKEALCIPDDYDVVALSPLGYPAEEGAKRLRKPLSEMVMLDNFKPYK